MRRYRPSTNRNIAGNAIPKQTIGMCTVSDSACIWRASFASGWGVPAKRLHDLLREDEWRAHDYVRLSRAIFATTSSWRAEWRPAPTHA